MIISAGALKSPQLLMLSGIGPKDVLQSVGIESVRDLPVGQTLQDHLCFPLLWEVDPSLGDSVNWLFDPSVVTRHRDEFLEHGTGPLKNFYSPMPIVYVRDAAIANSTAIDGLPSDVRRHLSNSDLPLAEVCPVLPSFGPDQSKSYLRVSGFPMATQSVGSIRLRSRSIEDQPLVDPKYLSTQFDVENAIALVRVVKDALQGSSLAPRVGKLVMGPQSDSDEGILQYIKQSVISAWHYGCSIKMGPSDDGTCSVDANFRVFGIRNLRVADTSVLPFLPQCHTQAVAYLIGEILAEKLLDEYDL